MSPNFDASVPKLIDALTGTFPLINSVASTMGTTTNVIIPYSSSRRWVMITNRSAQDTQDIGSSNVVVGSGIPLVPGGGFMFSGAGAIGPIYGVSTASGSAFSYVEG